MISSCEVREKSHVVVIYPSKGAHKLKTLIVKLYIGPL